MQEAADGADIVILRPADVPRLAAQGSLLPVPEELTRDGSFFEWRALLRHYGTLLCQWEGKAVALPLVGDAQVCFYPAALFDEARQKAYRDWQEVKKLSPAPLRAPATWDEYARLAEFLRDSLGRPSLPPLPQGEDGVCREFYTIAASHARRAVREDDPAWPGQRQDLFFFHYDESKAQPRIASEGFVEALSLMRRLQACRPPGSSPSPEAALADGSASLGIAQAGLSARLPPGKLLACPVPGVQRGGRLNRLPYLGSEGWMAVVPRSARSPDAAWSLLADLCGPARSMQTALDPQWGGGPTRVDQALRDRWGSLGAEGAAGQALKDAVAQAVLPGGLKNPVIALRAPRRQAMDQAVAQAVREALVGKKDAKAALEEADAAWRALGPADRLLAEYTLSVGLR
jgi:ABC-type glycerol-3-phosphate transport system substrate-binding protein